MSGSKRLPRRTTSAPAPGTPPSLWALTLTRSAPRAARSIGTWPQAAAASTCTVTPASRHSATTSCHRLQRPHLVVGPLAVHERGPGQSGRGQACRQGVGLDPPVAVDGQRLGRGQTGRGVTHGGVLDRGAEHRCVRVGPGRPPDGGVDGFGGPGGEDDLAGGRAEQRGHLLAGLLQCVPRDAGPLRAAGRDRPPGVRTRRAGRATASGRGGEVLA